MRIKMDAKAVTPGLAAIGFAMSMSVSFAQVTPAPAGPICKGLLKTTGGEKVATVTCSHDGSAKPTYDCKATWKLKNVNNVNGELKFNFNVNRGDSDKWKYDNKRVEGEKIKEEISAVAYTCT